MEDTNTKISQLKIDGVNYGVIITKNNKKKKPSPDKQFNKKLISNLERQEEEVSGLEVMYKQKFKIENKENKKYSIELFIRGGEDASLNFAFPPQYPSDVPPTYTLNAPWVREKKLIEIYRSLTTIYNDNFGRCIIYMWVDEILDALKKEKDFKNAPETEEEVVVEAEPEPEPEEDKTPEIFEGEPIWDRSSCFSPYLAIVHSLEDVKLVIEKIEDCRKVSTAWRNTYAYRFEMSKGKIMEVGEDGGEPKAGRNLLQRLLNYNAMNVIVYISRRVGGSLLGPDRYKHLNDAADRVLMARGFKDPPQAEKNSRGGAKKKDKKMNKKK